MVAARTLWYLGATAAAASAAAGGVMIYLGLRDRDEDKSIEGGFEGGGEPPPPVQPDLTPFDAGIMFGEPPANLRAEICVQWKIGNNRPNWRPALRKVVYDAVDKQLRERNTTWKTMAELQARAFIITRAALGDVCPDVPLPNTQESVESMQAANFYWDELWEVFYKYAFGKISGLSPGPSVS